MVIRSQTELAKILAAEGIEVTQATLSRDLDELGAVKLRGADSGAPVYVIPEDGSPVRGVQGGTSRLSSIAGDDTVAVIAREPLTGHDLADRFAALARRSTLDVEENRENGQ